MAADAAVAFLLEKVTGIIVGYADLISGAGKEFKQLQDDVKLLKTNINKLSKDPSVKEIQNQVRDVIYEVEDTIDSWLTQAAALKSKGKVKRLTKWLSPNHISLASQVKTLRQDRVKEMLDKTMTMGSTVGTTNEEEARGANTVRDSCTLLLIFNCFDYILYVFINLFYMFQIRCLIHFRSSSFLSYSIFIKILFV